MSAPRCAACSDAPPMRDWSQVPREFAGVGHTDLATGRPAVCLACWHAALRDPVRLADQQTREALDALARPADAFVRWPFPSLDALTGPLAPGTVHYLAAASGGGKTTLVTSIIRGWVDAGVCVEVLPLEAEAWAWRTHLACVLADVPPGDVLSGELILRAKAGDAFAERTLDRVRDQLRRMQRGTHKHARLAVHPDARISAPRIRELMRVAADRGAQVVVVDHIDHVEAAGAGASGLEASRAVNHAVLDGAKETQFVVVALSQLNASRFAGSRDRLAKYGTPQTRDLFMHTYKEQNATSILGLFRPLAPDADADLLSRARVGEVEPRQVLAPGVMGVAGLKLRNYGEREGSRAYLTVERGAARERTEDEARAWESAAAGITTGDDARVMPIRRRADGQRGAA